MMSKRYTVFIVLSVLASGPARGVTVTLTDGDSCVAMGSVSNNDGDAFSVVQRGPGGVPSKPYISTRYPSPGTYDADRRAVAEFSLDPMRRVSTAPHAVESAKLTFYFDDVIWPGLSPQPWTTQDFSLELYVDTADGAISGFDANDLDGAAGGQGTDDWASTPVRSWRFLAGATGPFTAGQEIVGMFGPDEPFPIEFGDEQLMIYGMIGFELDVTAEVAAALADPNVQYVGFRWISNTPEGYWTSMDPKGYLPALSVEMIADEPLSFALQSSDIGPISGDQHSGRPYHVFNDANDEAAYLVAAEWSGGHSPNPDVAWPIPDGIIEWDVFTDPNGASDRPEAVTYAADGSVRYVYWNPAAEDFVLVADENDVPEGWEKVRYEEWSSDLPLSIGNYGRAAGTMADMQHALLAEFKLERPGWYGLDPNALVSARIELTIDRVVDMSLSGNNMALLPSLLYVNSFAGDGVVGRFENAQADFERIDRENADTSVWLTMDGTPDGTPITDFSLSWWKLVEPGLGEPFTLSIDVTESLKRLLAEGAPFAGFVLSGSPDGDFCLASVDLVDDVRDKVYLPRLVLQTSLQ
jgi:hypothetical protein